MNNEQMNNEQILVRVKFFAGPREVMGTGEIELEIPAGATVGEFLELLTGKYPILQEYARFITVAVNRTYAAAETELRDGDEVACLPPVGGG